MKILALDASGIVASVAIASEDEIIAEYTVKYKKTHSQTLLPMIDTVMKFVDVSMDDIEYIAITNGPGSFTGLRIGAATAKGLAQAKNIPIVGVSTLEALAYNVSHSDNYICSIMDARRNNVFCGVYERNESKLEEVMSPSALNIEELVGKVNEMGRNIVFVGDGIDVWREYLRKNVKVGISFAQINIKEQKASTVAALALEYIKENKYVNSRDFNLNYLRKSQAERELEERNANK